MQQIDVMQANAMRPITYGDRTITFIERRFLAVAERAAVCGQGVGWRLWPNQGHVECDAEPGRLGRNCVESFSEQPDGSPGLKLTEYLKALARCGCCRQAWVLIQRPPAWVDALTRLLPAFSDLNGL